MSLLKRNSLCFLVLIGCAGNGHLFAQDQTEYRSLIENLDYYESLSDSVLFDALIYFTNEYEGENQFKTRAVANEGLGQLYRKNYDYEKGLIYFYAALDLNLQLNNLPAAQNICVSIGNCFGALEQFYRAEKYLQYSYDIHQYLGDSVGMAKDLNNLAGMSYAMGLRDEAKTYFEEAISVFKRYEEWGLFAETKLNFSAVCMENDPEYAMTLLEDYQAYMDSTGNFSEQTKAMCIGNIGAVYYRQGYIPKAIDYYEQSVFISESNDFRHISLTNYKDLTEIFEADQNFESAWYYQRKHDSLSVLVADKAIKEKALQNEFNYYVSLKNERANNLLYKIENQKLNQRKLSYSIWLLIAGLLLLVAVSVSIFIWFRNRTRQANQHREILKLRNKMISSHLEQELNRSADLIQELKMKEEDMTNLAIDIERKNEIQNKIHEGVKNLQRVIQNEEKMLTEIRELIHLSATNIKLNAVSEKMQVNLDDVNHRFFTILGEKFPELTTNEKKLCGLIRIKTSNKDIASIRAISPKSVEMSRYRLKKKLGLEAGDDLDQFISQI